jgi:gliding motility-associated protein GldE
MPLVGAIIENPWSFGISAFFLLVLLMCSALVSGSEVAFFSLQGSDLDQLKTPKDKQEEKVNKLINKPKELLATILIANNFINVAIVILSSFIAKDFLELIESDTLRMVLEIVVITFVILLLGEVIPKVYATKNALSLAKKMAKPLDVFGKIPPFSWIKRALVQGTDFISKIAKKKEIEVSADDLEQAVELTKDDEGGSDDHKILEGIIRFGSTDVKQIMHARTDTVAIDVSASYHEVLEVIQDCGFSRIPIYKETFDNVEGVLYVKDLLAFIHSEDSFAWQELIRQPFYVPENKKIDDLLKEFQEKKMHLSIVVDEYGGTSGIVTLEDVLEEIVGDISDEFDAVNIKFSQIDESNYVFEGKTPLIDLYKVLDVDGKSFEECKGESDSIAGFVIEQAGKILKKNEKIDFENFTFTIEASDKRRIKQVKVTIND